MKGRISVRGTNDANKRNKKLTFKNNAPFRSCKSKINNTFIDNAEDFGIVMPMYNLLEYIYSNRLYVGITISKSSALSINVLLIFDLHDPLYFLKFLWVE